LDLLRALEPPADEAALTGLVPELALARELGQGPYHHLDTFEHVMEAIRGVERELEERRVGARVPPERVAGLRVAALLHDVAKPVTRGEWEGRVIFVAHDTLGGRMVRRICGRLGLPAALTDAAATLTVLHLKIGFMESPRSDYPPERLARAAGPFGEELAVLSWADRLAAQGPRLRDEHVERHRRLCADFLRVSRKSGPYPDPDYAALAARLGIPEEDGAEVGYAASRVRLLGSRGMGFEEAVGYVRGTRRNVVA
jgi:poly(A) polymerase